MQTGLVVIDNGHADYCVLCATSLLHDDEPDVIEAQRVLNMESKAKAESAYYFLALLDASTTKGENIETTISNFTKFFEAHKLGALRRHIAGWGTPYWDCFRPLFWSRCMPDGLVLRTLYPSKGICKGDGRLSGYDSISLGDDHEYSHTEVCILCRFESELRWF